MVFAVSVVSALSALSAVSVVSVVSRVLFLIPVLCGRGVVGEAGIIFNTRAMVVVWGVVVWEGAFSWGR